MTQIKLLVFFFYLLLVTACAQDEQKENNMKILKNELNLHNKENNSNTNDSMSKVNFCLTDYLSNNKALDAYVDSIYYTLDETELIAQLIMPAAGKYGQSKQTIDGLIRDKLIGGLLMLNGTKDQFKEMIKEFEKANKKYGNLPFLYSADAEPSLVNRKITGSTPVKKANEIDSISEVITVAKMISKDLNEIGVNYNFAPVVDMSKNNTVGYRGFGKNPENIIPWSKAFISTSQKYNIIATAKHFPGHGLVSGDTHKSLQIIDGELKEIKNYPKLIENGVLSIMVAHIAIQNNKKYNTNGLPSTCSKRIVTSLLRDSLKFNGLIVTDAMGMGGVVNVPNNSIKAIQAGCDILLMPVDARKAHGQILNEYKSGSDEFKTTVKESVRRVIRMKVCLGLV